MLSSTKICDVGKCHRYKTKSKYPPKGEWVFSLAFNMLTNKYLLWKLQIFCQLLFWHHLVFIQLFLQLKGITVCLPIFSHWPAQVVSFFPLEGTLDEWCVLLAQSGANTKSSVADSKAPTRNINSSNRSVT